jgi:DeoR/GlpR family transcriptional regulator of sugar metabolism
MPNTPSPAGPQKLSPTARRDRVVELARSGGFTTTRELATRLKVSEMTVRRDVAVLAAAGRIRSVFGGAATAGDELAGGTDFQERARSNTAAKVMIGHAAASLIARDSLVALDNGTTTIELARSIDTSMPLGVVTPSLPVLSVLNDRPAIELTVLGGVLQPDLQAFAGPLTLACIEQLHVNQFFLSASAVGSGAVFCANQYDAMTKRALIDAADEVVLVVDSSKFARTASMMKVASLERVDRLVTDSDLSEDARQQLADAGVKVVEISIPATTGEDR